MPVRVGIIGLGVMGKVHFGTYARIRGAKVAAVCDIQVKKLAGDWSSIVGNIGGEGTREDLSAIRTYRRAEKLLADPEVDVIDITLPTHLHAEMAVKAFKAGKHVICEKPMARTSRQCREMIDARRKANRKLFVAQCIRFWPAYAEARGIVRTRKYGKVLSAVFTRLSATPDWSYRNWMQDPRKSGAAALDLHIHDADFILHLFGRPMSVTSRGTHKRSGGFDHIFTIYEYPDKPLVTAEGAWEYSAPFPFSMTFRIAMNKATLTFGSDGLLLYPVKGKARKIRTKPGDGYEHELRHFIECIRKDQQSDVVPPEDAMRTVKLIEAEVASAMSGKTVRPRL
jgi:predicted dehydrogenase